MTPEEKIYECLVNKTYKNKTHLDILLSTISDNKLVVGFLLELMSKPITYDIDINIPSDLLPNYYKYKSDTSTEAIDDYIDYYKKKITILNDEVLLDCKLLMDVLSIIITTLDIGGDPRSKLSNFSSEDLERVKNYLVEEELYEYIKYVEK